MKNIGNFRWVEVLTVLDYKDKTKKKRGIKTNVSHIIYGRKVKIIIYISSSIIKIYNLCFLTSVKFIAWLLKTIPTRKPSSDHDIQVML